MAIKNCLFGEIGLLPGFVLFNLGAISINTNSNVVGSILKNNTITYLM